MAAMRVSDPSRLHLKKELTQIRKAARVLRDPGTTSSWKSPLSTSRSAAAVVEAASNSASVWKQQQQLQESAFVRQDVNGNDVHLNTHFDFSQLPINNNNASGKDKEKRVFLYNWKNQKSLSKKEEDDVSFSIPECLDDNLSDARNGGDSKSDTYTGETRSASKMFRCRDTNNVALGMSSVKRVAGNKKKSRKHKSHLDILSGYQRKDNDLDKKVNVGGLPKGHPPMALSSVRGDSVEQSDDTEEYNISEDLRKAYGLSPLLLKLRQKGWAHSPSKLLRSSRKEDSSYSYSTPALSTSSFNRYNHRNPSNVGDWDATTTSFNDGDDEGDDNLDFPGRKGCGIPCYWSRRTPKHKGSFGGCYSPSLSDTLRRKGSSMLCGSQSMYHRHRRASSVPNKWRSTPRNAPGLVPLLANSADGRGGSSLGTGCSDDELSTNFGELDLEALSRLDGRRWSSSCRSQVGLEIVPLNGEGEEEGTPENIQSLSHKYKPTFFDELVGQNIVVQSLTNAILKGRIAPVYLLQGPRGTGKTSAARIFAAALNCQCTEETKPCGHCRDCSDIFSGKSRDLWEVDGTDKKKIDKVRYFLKKITGGLPSASSRYKVFVIDECHLLLSKTWLAFLKFLEESPQRIVFIFITTDPDNVPRTVQSRCQKYLFNKIKDGDIVSRLKKISSLENLDIESDALDLIALNADGSLRDAETMLDQLSLLGRKITTSLVNELVGVVSDEKLLELLELALSSNTSETVKRARELMDSGIDPTVLMSQLASLIMDIIAGTYNIIDAKYNDPFFGGRSLTEAELEKLKHALKLLSEAEKQIRVSSERSTWFTAALLQLGSVASPDFTLSSSSRRQSSRTTVEDQSSASREARYVPRKSTSPVSLHMTVNGNSSHQGELTTQPDGFGPSHNQLMDGHISSASHDAIMIGNMYFRNSDKLNDIWAKCIERCHSKTLRQLLHAHGKLLSISEVEGVMVAYIAFGDETIKSRVERFLSSIRNSIEMVLRCNVEIRIIILPVAEGLANHSLVGQKRTEATIVGSRHDFEAGLNGGEQGYCNSSPLLNGSMKSTSGSRESLAEANSEINGTKPKRQVIPMQRIESIIREQRLETAWLQAMDKGTPGSLSRLKPEKNQILPQDSTYNQTQLESATSIGVPSQHWEDELNHELKVLKMQDKRTLQKDQPSRRIDHYTMSPSLLHHSAFAGSLSRENLGYESGAGGGGCSGLFCWNTNKRTHIRGKVKRTTNPSRGSRRFCLFGECGQPKNSESRSRR
ncbi:AAA-type ATPase family protein putative isoform 1 [Tripterygium wilfordii]|uniref:AAA-type ATPase family protein putative isoform 1 n=1 Tax=Tripterygium wilfordii TaxID=458696 RepID=A0A7J7CGI1_TRIWF|nr:protein STICHEL-like [Tripterygium wilfordii]XP_038681952.1 protein STICHEL-like [Tripterygium wilfordii]XP_038681953.1 protein STICHEL-like [Tripterygium wilfordii]KAF5733146.1 AAA-type ATPase family protein putative isoform 1 [Tripterygium wilfordii]